MWVQHDLFATFRGIWIDAKSALLFAKEWEDRYQLWQDAVCAEASRIQQEKADLIKQEQREAEKRANAWLESYLDEVQLRTWRIRKEFDFTSQLGHRYRLTRSCSYNVLRINKKTGEPMYALCAGPEDVPMADVILSQYLMLRFAERQFVSIANRDQY